MFKTSIEEFERWISTPETYHIEFKAARSSFDSKRELPEYCAGIANTGGGKLILGVDDNRQIVGSHAFQGSVGNLPQELFQLINHNVQIEELDHPRGRVVIFHIPGRRIGNPVVFKGHYLMRRGSSLVEMDQQTLRSVLNEVEPDFSSQFVSGLKLEDLDNQAVDALRSRWATKANRPDFNEIPPHQVLQDLELINGDDVTYAALILVGSSKAIGRYLADSEIIFEWRTHKEQIHHDARKTWRGPYTLVAEEILPEIGNRNKRFPFQEGFFQRDIFAFDEKSVREAVNNACAHRDYRLKGPSVFIKLSYEEFFIESPGGFPPGVSPSNILDVTVPRNRLLAEVMNKVGFVERSGQGLNDIFKRSIRDGKDVPQIWEADHYWVRLKIPAQVQDVEFVKFLEQVTAEKQILFSLPELIELESIRRAGRTQGPVTNKRLLDLGLVEKINDGRASRYILSHRYYAASARTGEYTRLAGLSREQQKQLILNHLIKNGIAATSDIVGAFTDLKPKDVSNLLQELRRDGLIVYEGKIKSGRWRLNNKLEAKRIS